MCGQPKLKNENSISKQIISVINKLKAKTVIENTSVAATADMIYKKKQHKL